MKAVPLACVGKIVTGKTPKTNVSEFYEGNIPFVTPSDMDGQRFIEQTGRNLSDAGVATVRNCVIPRLSVVVSCIGSDMGKTHLSASRCVTNQQINSIVIDSLQFDPFFVYYNLFGRRQELRRLAAGAAQPILNKTEFGKVVIDFPILTEQREIAATLGVLDDKIELNRKTVATLEQMARALYRSWFVDFDPVRARAEDRVPAYMDPTNAALFPDNFSKKGLPMGWKTQKLNELIERLKVSRLYDQKSVSAYGSVPVFDQGKEGFIGFHNNEPNVQASPEERISVFANHTCIQRLADFNFSTIQNVIPFRGRSLPTEWCHYASLGLQKFEEYRGHWPSFIEHEVTVPPIEIASIFKYQIDVWLQLISVKNVEIKTLVTLRDTLLPRLMSGELRVGAAHDLVEEVA